MVHKPLGLFKRLGLGATTQKQSDQNVHSMSVKNYSLCELRKIIHTHFNFDRTA